MQSLREEVMQMQDRKNPKYEIEIWISILSRLHSCLGLNREGDKHPLCKEFLTGLMKDMEEVRKSL